MGLNCSQCGLRYKPGDTVCHADGSALVESDDELLGETIGNYRIVRLLGEGGMGRVYLGLHPRIGSRVAVKLLSPQASTDDELVQRFFSEAQLVNKVRHEGIVNVLDLDQLPDGRPFIIMEFLDGAPLSAVIAEGPMAMPRAVRIGIEILEALDAAHACGVVHRDLKPDNIFITPKGRVKLLDFGIAKLMPEFQTTVNGPATRTGALLGTPGYMAPEQVTGEEISGATDVYAVGAILFEALTGSMAFAAGTLFELLRRIVSDPPPPMRERRPDLAPALEAVVVCALQKSPAARFGSAAAMAGALRNVLKSFGPEALVAAAEPILVPAHPGRTPTPRELALGSEATLAPGALAPPQNLALGSEATVFPSPIANAKEREAAAFAETQHSVSRDDAAALAKTQHSLAQPPAGTMPVPGRDQRYSEAPNMAGAGAAQTASQAKSRRGVFVAGAALATAGALAVALLAGGDQETAPTAAAAPSFDAGVVASLPSGAEAEPADAGARNGDAATADPPTIGAAREPRTAKRPPRATTKTGTTTPSSIPSEPEPAAPALDAGHVVLKAHPSKGEFHIKPDFNPKAFDGAAYVPKARKLAKRLYADAVLTEFDVEGVAANGLADLTLSSFEATYMFRSPSHSKRTLPIGVDDERPCWVYVEVDKSGVTTRIVTRDECKGAARPNPKCSMREVWKRSDSLGMPPQKKGALAHVTYLWDGWFFDIDPLDVTGSIPDDC